MLSLIPSTSSQIIEINQISEGNGYILLRTEKLEMIESYTEILHPIDMNDYKIALESALKNLVIRKFENDTMILNLIQEIEDKIFELKPQTREKRGLINLHGKFLKWIGGTMDDDDRVEIEGKFNTIDKNLDIIADAVNNQTTRINKQFEKEINIMAETINKQNLVIVNKTIEITRMSNYVQRELEWFKARELVKENLRYLLTKLEKLEDIVLHCRLGILSRNILTSEEIHEYNLTINHLKYIKTAVAQFKGKLLIFIQIPKFSSENFYVTNVVPIPTKDNLELDAHISKIIVHKNDVFYYNENKEIRKLKSVKEKCIEQILKSTMQNCNMINNSNPSIVKINKDIIVTKNLNKTKLIHNCNNHDIVIQNHLYI